MLVHVPAGAAGQAGLPGRRAGDGGEVQEPRGSALQAPHAHTAQGALARCILAPPIHTNFINKKDPFSSILVKFFSFLCDKYIPVPVVQGRFIDLYLKYVQT